MKLALCAIAVTFTYSLIEKPARHYFNQASHRLLTFAAFALLVVAVVLGGLKIRSDNYASADRRAISSGGVAVHSPGGKSIVVAGDSQGSMYGAELLNMARSAHWNLNVISIADGNELPNEPGTDWPKVETFLAKARPDVIILAEAWDFKLGKDTANVRQALARFKQLGARVVLLGQPPILPEGTNRSGIRAGLRPPFIEDKDPGVNRLRAVRQLQTVVGNGVDLLDVAPLLTNPDGSVRLIADDGRLIYQDPHHLSDKGAALVGPALKQAIERALTPPSSP